MVTKGLNPKPTKIIELTISIMTLIAAVAAIVVSLYVRTTVIITQDAVDGLILRVDQMDESIKRDQLAVTYPTNNAVVEIIDLVQGITPYEDMNHYIVITPVDSGVDFIQEGPVNVIEGGSWHGIARFGTAGGGVGLGT